MSNGKNNQQSKQDGLTPQRMQPGKFHKYKAEKGEDYKILKRKGDDFELADSVVAVRKQDDLHLYLPDDTKVVLEDFYQVCQGEDPCTVTLTSDEPGGYVMTADNAGKWTGDASYEVVYSYGDLDTLNLPSHIRSEAESGLGYSAIFGGIAAGALLGGLASGSSSGSGGGNNTDPDPEPTPGGTENSVIIKVVGGPIIAGNGLQARILDASGNPIDGTFTLLGDTGEATVAVSDYTGVIIVRISDANSGADYLDEATNANKDLTTDLYAIAEISGTGNTVNLNVNPLTTVAYQLAVADNGDALQAAQVASLNSAVAALFGLDTLHGIDIVTLFDDYDPDNFDGVNQQERYGEVLAILSGMDAENQGDTAATISTLVAGISISPDTGTASFNETTQQAINQGAYRADQATGQNTLSTVAENTVPTIVDISLDAGTGAIGNYLNTGDSINITVTTSEEVLIDGIPGIELQIGDDLVSAAYLSGNGSNRLTFVYTVTDTDTDSNGISLPAGEILLGESASIVALSDDTPLVTDFTAIPDDASLLVDTTLPNVTITDEVFGSTNERLTFFLSFNEAVFGLDAEDIAVSGGTAENFTQVSDRVFSIEVDPDANSDESITVDIPAGVALDAAGNTNTEAAQNVQPVDTIAPVLTITESPNAQPNGDKTFFFIFSEAVSGFTADDINVSGGTGSNFAAESDLIYTLLVSPDNDATTNISLEVAANAAEDAVGNGNIAASETDQTGDGESPVIVITDDEDGVASGPVNFFFIFSNSVSDFVAGDITVSGGTKGAFTAITDSFYSLVVTPDADSTTDITVDVAANVAVTSEGVGNIAAEQNVQPVDTEAPAITISNIDISADTGTSASDFVTNTSNQTITASLSAALGENDILLGSLDAGVSFIDITGQASNTAISWSGLALAGSSSIQFKVQDAAGNDGAVASQSYTIDAVPPSTPSVNIGTSGTLTPSVTGAAILGDGETLSIEVNGATYSGISLSTNSTYILNLGSATPTSGTLGTFVDGSSYEVIATVTDTAGNTSVDGSSLELSIDTTVPTTPTVDSFTSTSLTPTLTGTAVVGSDESLTININGATYVNVPVGSGNAWSLDLATATPDIGLLGALADGRSYNVTATVTDSAGNSSSDISLDEIIIDIAAPTTPTVDTLTTSSLTPTISGTAFLDSAEVLSVIVNGATYSPVIPNGAGFWTINLGTATPAEGALGTLTDGTYNITATIVDSADRVVSDVTLNELTIDTTPPIPNLTSITDNVGSITGVLSSGDRTDDTSLILAGTNEAGSTVFVYNNTTLLGQASVSGTNWSYTAAVTNGTTYNFNVRETDAVGNASTPTSNVTITSDTVAPTADLSTITDDFGTITGALSPGDTTDDTSLVLSGTNEEGSSVFVYDLTTLLGPATVTGTTWTYTANVANGTTYRFNVRETDIAGNASAATGNFILVVDNVASTANLTSATDDVGSVTGNLTSGDTTDDTNLLLSGTNGTSSTVNVYNGTTLLGAATVVGSNWTYTAAVADGVTYQFNVIETDLAGNVSSPSANFTVIGDTTAPTANLANIADDVGTVTGSLTSGDTTDDPNVVLSGTNESNSTVAVYNGTTLLGGATVTGGTWSYTAAIADGTTYQFNVVETDPAGNASSPTSNFTVIGDTSAPIGVISSATDDVGTVTGSLSSGDTTDDTSLVLNGTAEAGSTVNVYNGAALLGAATVIGTSWTYTATIVDGVTYQFNVIETDAAGNTGSASSNFTIIGDTTAPTANFTAATDDVGAITGTLTSGDVTDDTSLLLSGSNEAGSTVAIYDGTTLLGAATVLGTSWSYTATVNDGTTYQFNVIETDAAGNASAATSNFTVIGDTTAPTLESSTPADDATGVALDSNFVLDFDENIQLGTGNIVITNGSDTVTIDVTAPAGQLSITNDMLTINPTADLTDGLSTYHFIINNTAILDEAGNNYAGIATNTVLNFDTAADPTVVVFDLTNGYSSDHSSQTFSAAVAYDIYIIADSAAASPGLNVGETWTGGGNLGADDQIILVGTGAPISNVNAVATTANRITWSNTTGAVAQLQQGGVFQRLLPVTLTYTDTLWTTGNWASNPNNGATLGQVYFTTLPATVTNPPSS